MAAQPGFADADLSALELVIIAGARVSGSTLRAWLDNGVPLRQAYGMTELGGFTTVNPPEEAVRRPGSVGRGTVFTRHLVVRPDGTDCAAEEPGEIIVSGRGVSPGYWRNESAYAEVMRDGWFHSGDANGEGSVWQRDAAGSSPRTAPPNDPVPRQGRVMWVSGSCSSRTRPIEDLLAPRRRAAGRQRSAPGDSTPGSG